MVSPIAHATSPLTAHQSPPANVDAELAKCESQLADWVHCPSGKTPEGKAKIEAISARIDTLKAQQEVQLQRPYPHVPSDAAPTVQPPSPTLSYDGLGAHVNAWA